MKVNEAVGKIIASMGAGHVFGVIGSGNFRATNALLASPGPSGELPKYTAARHEMGAACMADNYTRVTGQFSVLSVHQGPGYTNAITGLAEAAKSRTPLIVLTGDTEGGNYGSNFWMDQDKVAEGIGAIPERLFTADSAVLDTVRAVEKAVLDRRTVILSMPLDIQEAEIPASQVSVVDNAVPPIAPMAASASPDAIDKIVKHLSDAQRPVILAGRGGSHAVEEIRQVAELSGSLLTTSAVGRGLFNEDPWHMDAMGGFATDGAAALTQEADVLLVFGAALNRWTTRNGSLLENKTVIQVDDQITAFGRHYPVDLQVLGDSRLTAAAIKESLYELFGEGKRQGYRLDGVRERLLASRNWRDQEYEDSSEPAGPDHDGKIDPRTLTNRLDELLPMARIVSVDGGNFNAYPAMHFRVPDNKGYCAPLAFQSIGLAISSVMGVSTALKDRIPIAGVGDGGFMMSHVELDTAVRMKIPLVVVVYNDSAYGAEVHHFIHETDQLDTVRFPETDIASLARGYGCEGVTVRKKEDLTRVEAWVSGPRDRPLVIDAKITDFPSWVLAHTFGDNE